MRPAASLLLLLLLLGTVHAQPAGDDESALLVGEARAALRDGDYRRAGDLLDRALALDPRQVHVYVLRASVHGALGQYDRGIAVMRKARRLAPDNVDVLTALGSQLVLARKHDEGVPILEKVVARDGKRYEALILLARVYAERRRWSDAVRAYDGYLAARPASLAGQDMTHRIARADAVLRAGEPGRARDDFRALLKREPENLAARLGLAWATAAIDCGEALRLLTGLRQLESTHPQIALLDGRCAVASGMRGRAERALEAYRKARPDDAAGWGLAGDIAALLKDLDAAAAAYRKAGKREPAEPLWSLRRARIERLQGAAPAAVRRLRAAGAPPGRADEWTVELAECLIAAGQHAEVRALLEPFVAGKGAPVRTRLLLGLAMVRLGDPPAAIPHLQLAVDSTELGAEARRPLQVALGQAGVRAYRNGDLARARELLERAAALGGDPITLRNLGLVLLVAGLADRATEPLKQAVELSRKGARNLKPTDAVALQLLGRAYRTAGKPSEAVATLRQGLAAAATPEQQTDLRVDLAGALLDGDQAEEAVDVLAAGMGGKTSDALKARLADALAVAVRAASTQALASGAFRRAYKLLDDAEPRVPAGRTDDLRAIRCDAALAATAAGLEDVALRRLRELARAKVTCPFVAPADTLAVPILLAWAEGQGSLDRARRALDALEKLRRRATGPAEPLLSAALRDVALRATATAFARNDLASARRYLDAASRVGRDSRELDHAEAVILLASGKSLDKAIATFRRTAGDVPEAHLNLGIAADLQGKPLDALEHYKRAAAAGVKHPALARWIDSHERVWGTTP